EMEALFQGNPELARAAIRYLERRYSPLRSAGCEVFGKYAGSAIARNDKRIRERAVCRCLDLSPAPQHRASPVRLGEADSPALLAANELADASCHGAGRRSGDVEQLLSQRRGDHQSPAERSLRFRFGQPAGAAYLQQ